MAPLFRLQFAQIDGLSIEQLVGVGRQDAGSSLRAASAVDDPDVAVFLAESAARPALSRTTVGRRKTIRLRLVWVSLVERNRRPSNGMSPSRGTFDSAGNVVLDQAADHDHLAVLGEGWCS